MAIDSTNSLGTGNLSLQKAGESQVDDVMRAMPHALGPEKSILSSMLQNPLEYVSTAIEEKLTKEHFYLPARLPHQTHFQGGKLHILKRR
jgi:replicative DNA helicase